MFEWIFKPAIMIFFYSNFLAAILKMANLTVIELYFSLETVIFAFYGNFPIRMRMSPFSTNDVRMDLFLGFESRLMYLVYITDNSDYMSWYIECKQYYFSSKKLNPTTNLSKACEFKIRKSEFFKLICLRLIYNLQIYPIVSSGKNTHI